MCIRDRLQYIFQMESQNQAQCRLSIIGRHLDAKQDLQRPPIKVTITGAAGNIGYGLAFMIGQGRMLGRNQPIDLMLLELPAVLDKAEGVMMELQDSALPLLSNIRATSDVKEAFTGCQIAILVGAKPRGPGMERKDLLSANSKIFQEQGRALNEFADRNVKVCVVGNPANTNCLIASHFAPNIPKRNFTALTRLDQNRALYQLANKLQTGVENIKNVIIWGNHSLTQFPDVNHGYLEQHTNQKVITSLRSAINDEKWIEQTFIPVVQKRGAEIIKKRGTSSANSAANAVCDHIHDWLIGTQPGEYVSMGVISEGQYGIPKDIVFSYPVTCTNGEWTVVEGFKWDESSVKRIKATTEELLEEKSMALN
eukprot:TRINITY_DN780_c0_g1_i2.p1 TRINITY_DN780_c0_g1~~TRINITY_DN780_c0_g1_i2.p1  ORF type:complete len:368 (+),score=71.49 TRINITY_DN780_c0_g1_i2:87-1190(+)